MTTNAVTLEDARDPARALWLRNVYPFYLHDLSEFGSAYSLGEDGVWQPDHLEYWMREPFCHPLVLAREGRPAGFALVGAAPFPFMSPDVEFHVAEFFVLRSERRYGVGRLSAEALFRRFRGSFELTVLDANASALRFWRSVLPGLAGGVREEAGAGEVRFVFTTA